MQCYVTSSSLGSVYSNQITVPALTQPQVFNVYISTNLTVCSGASLTLTASTNFPTGAPFVWQQTTTGTQVQGNSFTVPATSLSDLQSITVQATAASSACVQSPTATANTSNIPFNIEPLTYPSVSLSQSVTPVVIGSTVTFTATPGGYGSGTPVYTWQLNGTTVPNVSGNSFSPTISTGAEIQSISVSMNPTYTCPQNAAVATTSFQVVSSDWENQNYIRVQDILVAGISDFITIDHLPIGQKRERTTYLDGLGRPIQKLDKSGSLVGGTSTDLVVPVAYDAAGRNVQHYLPYTTTDNPGMFKSSNVLTEQATFVTTKFGEPSGAPTYSQTIYENNPLERITRSLAPGSSWGGNNIGTSYSYDFNSAPEMVHIWTLAYSATAIPVSSPTAVYGAGTLFKNTTTDEKGNQVITYIDYSGDTILKKVQLADASSLSTQHAGWACTYYVYDDFNQLRYVITPKLVDYLDNNSWALTQQLVNDLCFVYAYDGKGRLISRKQPGIGETDVVYDQRDRPIFTQDALGQTNNQWKVLLYDALDRVTTSGVLQASFTPAALQSSVNASTGNIIINEDAGTSANLLVTGQQNGASQYVAANSIIFQNFKSDANGTFIAYINPNLGPIVPEAVAIADNPVPANTSIILLAQTFYDDYSQGTKSYTTADNSLFDPSTNQQALPLPSQYDPHTRGRITVSKVKVITNPADLTQGNWLETDNFYDNQGRVVQTQNDNSLGGTDIVTNRFDFAGKSWGSCVKHMAGSSTQFTIVSRNAYDNLGRLTDLAKNFNSTFFKDLASYTYDEYGKMTSKTLAPGYTGSGKNAMETLNYSYNIQGWLTGINNAYALDQNTYDQWNDFFGLYVGYDNRDNQFTAAKYDGSITGVIWKSQGDNSMRRYDYTYDNMGRLTGATFLQRQAPANSWDNSVVDLSESISYIDKNGNNDKNGNIQSMVRKGLVPGVNIPVTVDNLAYTYGTPSDQNSNQLARVDETANFAGNGKLYDFADGSNGQGPTPDYSYDANGNLTQDQNKGITDVAGIKYNYLNKPYSVTIAGKTLISYTYDANGEKLSKTVTDLTVTPNVVTTTTYDDEFVYQNNVLQFVLHDEGRLKIITPVNSAQQQLNAGTTGANNVLSGKQGVFEYFIKDQLSNVRLVLTEQSQTEFYIATMETSSSADPNLGTDEAKLFGKVDPTTGNPTPDNEVNLTRTLTTQTPWTGNSTANVCHLSAAPGYQTIGPNMLLKVSAGDVINTSVSYFYFTNSPAGPTYTGSDAVTALIGALLGGNMAAVAEANSGAISTNLGAASSNFSSFINKYYTNNSGSAPKAFLTVLFFDEQFNFIPQDNNAPNVGTNLAQVNSANNQSASPLILGQKAPKNGYVYIYLSNESNQDVYFDNLSVSQVHGNIEEENHYYAYGEKIGGLSTTAFGGMATKYRFEGDYSEEEENTLWDEFELRNYDPQIGRWTGVDPYDQFANPYVGMGSDPVNNIDPDGGDLPQLGVTWGGIIGGSLGTLAGASLYLVAKNNKWNGFWSVVAGAGGALVGSGLGYATGEYLFPGVSYEGSWGNNFVAFYKGLFGDVSGNTYSGPSRGQMGDPHDNAAVIPSIWGGLSKITLPNLFSFLKINDDVFRVGEEVLLDVTFVADQSQIDFKQTDKNQLDKTINKVIRSLRKDKHAELSLSGGTDFKDNIDTDLKDRSTPHSFRDLVRERVQAIQDYIKNFTKNKKILRRIYDNGKIIRTAPKVMGKIVN
ncbi:hypothetical protein GCM10011511_02650 [Puia dinghuensis]|uniref:Ig-like domain-containing protein n=1 Tax=Puia dinghuensis TaxID=1792502 RepID=A0A8J2XQJ7_9BACT|nr:hypothetical protein GCM10011511_02650 [Puia dinghuensis]